MCCLGGRTFSPRETPSGLPIAILLPLRVEHHQREILGLRFVMAQMMFPEVHPTVSEGEEGRQAATVACLHRKLGLAITKATGSG